MIDYEAMILEKQDDIYDGEIEQTETITITEFNLHSGRYEIKKTLTGDAARAYMEANGIW